MPPIKFRERLTKFMISISKTEEPPGKNGGGGGEGASSSLRSTNLRLSSALVPQTLSFSVCVEDS